MKYRIKEIDGMFYPQKRVVFIWLDFRYGRVEGSYIINFPSKIGATGYIKCIIKEKQDKKTKATVIIHEFDNTDNK